MTEASSLATVGAVIYRIIESYGCDAKPLFAKADLDLEVLSRPGARYPLAKLSHLWELAAETTGDPCLGLKAARYINATSFHAIGFSWLASPSVAEALNRVARYERIINTAIDAIFERQDDLYRFYVEFIGQIRPTFEAVDAATATLAKVCRLLSNGAATPTRVVLRRPDIGQEARYTEAFRAPVSFGGNEDALYFDAEVLERPLPTGNPELASVNDRVAEDYLRTLDPSRVASEVRGILTDMLPSGAASQESVARNLNRSLSTLQRRLREEGTSYKDILEDTRRSLALRYVRDGEYSFGEITYLLGFADQSNFSRAFKRWTGTSPREYRA